MASYYELLEVAPTASPEIIKSAFRREIARYHPDKVQHLGVEFRALAAGRAATLTAAYKTLLDPVLRAEYDAMLAAGPAVVAPPPPATPAPRAEAAPAPPPENPLREAAGRERFADTRVNRDMIMMRTVADQVREAVTEVIGVCDEAEVRGFDLVLVPRGGGGLLRSAVPMRVLMRCAPLVDAALASEMWSAAVRARLHLTGASLCVLLIGKALAPAADIEAAIARQRARQIPGTPKDLAVVPVDLRDWSARVPADAAPAVVRLVERLHKWTA